MVNIMATDDLVTRVCKDISSHDISNLAFSPFGDEV